MHLKMSAIFRLVTTKLRRLRNMKSPFDYRVYRHLPNITHSYPILPNLTHTYPASLYYHKTTKAMIIEI